MWAAADSGGGMVVTMASMLMLARMMTPAEFGTGALVIGAIGLVNFYVEGLFHDALIQTLDADDDLYAAAVRLGCMVALGVVAIGLVFALASTHTAWAQAAWLFTVTSLVLPVNAALGVCNARMRRDLIFREVARASLAGKIGGAIIGVGLAISGAGVWSLIGQCMAGIIIQTVLLFAQSGWRPPVRGSIRAVWPICRFALPYAFMNSLSALRSQLFLLMVAGVLTLAASGYVNVAFRLTTTPQLVLIAAFVSLGLPLLSRHQGSPKNMERSFVEFTQLVSVTTLPAFVGLCLTANDAVPVLLGDKWVTVVPLVQILAIGAALTFLRFPSSAVLRSLGYVRYSFASSVFQLLFTVIGMAVIRPHDLTVAVWLWVAPVALQLPVAAIAVTRRSSITFKVLLGSLLPATFATIAMSVVVVLVSIRLPSASPAFRLFCEVAAGATTAGLSLLLFDGKRYRAILHPKSARTRMTEAKS